MFDVFVHAVVFCFFGYFNILIVIFELRHQSRHVVQDVARCFFLCHNFAHGVHRTQSRKNFKTRKNL